MGIRFHCPNGHKLHVKSFQAGQRGFCPHCGVGVDIPLESTRPSSRRPRGDLQSSVGREVGEVVEITQHEAASDEIRIMELDPSPSPQSPAAPAPPPSPPKPDPLSGAEDVVWYVRSPSGNQYGPTSPANMRTWIAERRITPDSLVWREGWRDWQEAQSVFPELAENADAVPEVESILADAGVAQQSWTGSPARMPSQTATGSPLLIMGIVVGLGVAFLVAVWLWMHLSS
jgi:hypothetical protein